MRPLRFVGGCVVLAVLVGCQLAVAVVGERGSASSADSGATGDVSGTSANTSVGATSGGTGETGGFGTTSDSAATTGVEGDTTGFDVGGSTLTTGFGSTDGTGFQTDGTGPFGESTAGLETEGTTMDPVGSGGSSG